MVHIYFYTNWSQFTLKRDSVESENDAHIPIKVSYLEGERVPKNRGVVTKRIREAFN